MYELDFMFDFNFDFMFEMEILMSKKLVVQTGFQSTETRNEAQRREQEAAKFFFTKIPSIIAGVVTFFWEPMKFCDQFLVN